MRKTFGKSAAAAVVYIGFAVYLYQPHFNTFKKLQFLILVNFCLSSLGCFLLSRRWVSCLLASLFAGAIYGFGPFSLGLSVYHPTAGFLTAMMPWLFLPAAFGPKGKWQWLRGPLAVLPFLAILLFFAARRLSVLIIFCLGVILASCPPMLGVSPIIWLSFSMLCCSIIAGVGMQGLCSAGLADRRWILLSMAFMTALAIVTLLQATKYFQVFMGFGDEYAHIFLMDAKMFIAGAVALLAVFFIARAKLRLAWLRWAILGTAIAVDIFFGARFVVDMMF